MSDNVKHPGKLDRMCGNKVQAEVGPSSPDYLPKQTRKVRLPKLKGVSK